MIGPISRRRKIKDRLAAAVAAACGGGIIFALALMLGYLFWEAAVLAWPAGAQQVGEVQSFTGDDEPAREFWLSGRGDRMLEVSSGGVRVRDWTGGKSDEAVQGAERLRDFGVAELLRTSGGDAALALDKEGRALLFEPRFNLEWEPGTTDYHKGVMVPEIRWPVGTGVLKTGLSGLPDRAAFYLDERSIRLLTSVGRSLQLMRWPLQPSVFGDGYGVGSPLVLKTQLKMVPEQLLIGSDSLLYVLGQRGQLELFRVEAGRLQAVETLNVLPGGSVLGDAELLLGGRSLVVGDRGGMLRLWRAVRPVDGGSIMRQIRHYDSAGGGVGLIVAEPQRKGFFVFDEAGGIQYYYLGEQSRQYRSQLPGGEPVRRAWLEPAGRKLAVQSGSGLGYWQIENEYADVSTGLLWAPRWYEGYEGAEWVWQSTSADADFEPKFSLLPLVLGTLKGAFYAMLFAVPIALLAAVYVARFMAPQARSLAKPAIEMMAALPTVILGFLAALWLAPLAASHLSGILLGIALLPLSLIALGWGLYRLSALRRHIPEGWEFVPAVPVCILVCALAVFAGLWLDEQLFGGDFIVWMDEYLGLGYEQRNAAIVGIAMSFAVIPTIFSIAEDALFQAPKSLLEGGLSLGATHWESVLRIIIPTASPGIFSALIIGLGRAVGETMVVVMATGNTPLLDWLPFTGMRTLSANIAVEMPEAEIGSSHYHLLFLSAMLLFMMTFAANSLAEYVRHRLRSRYANL